MKELQPDGGYRILTGSRFVDVDAVHAYLTTSYWSQGIPRAVVERAVANSVCFSLLHAGTQVGFARVITDRATFAYLCDVYVLEEHRGRGLGKQLVGTAVAHEELADVRRYMLMTADAQGLYRQMGFGEIVNPDRCMEITRANSYPHAAG